MSTRPKWYEDPRDTDGKPVVLGLIQAIVRVLLLHYEKDRRKEAAEAWRVVESWCQTKADEIDREKSLSECGREALASVLRGEISCGVWHGNPLLKPGLTLASFSVESMSLSDFEANSVSSRSSAESGRRLLKQYLQGSAGCSAGAGDRNDPTAV